jgi:hypothetical protein
LKTIKIPSISGNFIDIKKLKLGNKNYVFILGKNQISLLNPMNNNSSSILSSKVESGEIFE